MRGRFRQSSIFFYCADRLHASSSMRVDFPIVSSKRDGTAFCSSHLALDLLVEWRDGCLESGPALPASAFGRSSPIRGGGFSLLPFALGFIHRPFCSPPCVASHLDVALFPSRPSHLDHRLWASVPDRPDSKRPIFPFRCPRRRRGLKGLSDAQSSDEEELFPLCLDSTFIPTPCSSERRGIWTTRTTQADLKATLDPTRAPKSRLEAKGAARKGRKRAQEGERRRLERMAAGFGRAEVVLPRMKREEQLVRHKRSRRVLPVVRR